MPGAFRFIGSLGLIYLAYFASCVRHGVPAKTRAMLLAGIVGVTGEAIWFVNERHWTAWVSGTISLLVVTGIIVWLPPAAYLKVLLSDGTTLRLYWGDDLRRLAIWWNSSGEIFIGGLPRLDDLGGEDAVKVLRALLKGRTAFATRATSEAAYDLVRASGGVGGLLHALEGFRLDNTGRVLLSDLPKVYLVALDLALSTENGHASISDDLRERALEAASIAQEAETLDEPPE